MATINVNVPLKTEVIEEHHKLVTKANYDEQQESIIVEMDVRRAGWRKILKLPRGTKIHWADIRTIDIKELSALLWPISYRLTYGDGWYRDKQGNRHYFPIQPHLMGIDLARQCTQVVLRAAVLLSVMSGVGLRSVCWLMHELFHVDVSKSSLDRWIKQCAAQLPDAAGMAKILNANNPITQAHFDEIFAKGQRPKHCTIVLRDEYGRIFAAKEVQERNENTVTQFLKEVKGWGIELNSFYVDGCEAYRKAIQEVFPEAIIQYDYFHIIQSILKKLRRAFVSHRRELKQRTTQVDTPWYKSKLDALSKRLWEKRGLIFKNPENISSEENRQLLELMEQDHFIEELRCFMHRVWSVFQDSKNELSARQRLGHLKQRKQVTSDPQSAFAKSVAFLEGRFEDMIGFLRHPGIKRNSLAETGIRCLRRLERGHDGFRTAEGLQRYLRIYQAVKYCGWTVHRSSHELGLPMIATATGPPTANSSLDNS